MSSELTDKADHREAVEDFLYREARLLDEQQLHDWLDLVTEDVDYRVPVRTTRERGAEQSEFSRDANIFKEEFASLDARVRRFDKEYAWSENPPTRTRRFVTNVEIVEVREEDDELDISSNVLVFRAKEDEVEPDFIAGRRADTLRWVDGELRIAERVVYLDHTVLDTRPLSVFL